MLVVGDSLIAGQGLREEEHKIYTLTQNWLETEVFRGERKVNLKNKSHSGSKLFLSRDEINAFNEAEKDPRNVLSPRSEFFVSEQQYPDLRS